MAALVLLTLFVFVVLVVAAANASGGPSTTPVVVGRQRGLLGATRWTLPRESRLRQYFVEGPTGGGKSTLLKELAWQDAAAPERFSVVMIDIKDALVLELAGILPPERRDDVLLVDFADTEWPVAFNPLAGVSPSEGTLVVGELLSAFRRLFERDWGPRMNHVLRNALWTLTETPGATLLDIVRLLVDERFRMSAISRVTNAAVRLFWEQEWPGIVGTRGSLANIEALLNKVSVMTVYPELRNCLGQRHQSVNLAVRLAARQLILVNIPQGVLGEEGANFLASLVFGQVQLAAQRRVRLAASARHPWYVYCDEAQNYATSAFVKVVTEGRGYGLGLVAAAQYIEEFPADIRQGLVHNCPYRLRCNQVRGRHRVEVVDLQAPPLPRGVPEPPPLVLDALPPRSPRPGQLEAIRVQSRARLARPRAQVERELNARTGPTGDRQQIATNTTQKRPASRHQAREGWFE